MPKKISPALYQALSAYIAENLEPKLLRAKMLADCSVQECKPLFKAMHAEPPNATGTLEDFLDGMDAGFADTLLSLIDAKGMTDVECYKKANIDKKTFSKIKCKPDYRPSKQTALAFAIALELNLEETQHLLGTAGLALSHSSKFDLIIEYFIRNGIYDMFEINEALYEFDQMLLGC